MNLKSAKVYFDGSHYIAIPRDAFPHRKKGKASKQSFRIKTEEQPRSNSPPETKKERFEKAYRESLSMPKRERKKHIKEKLENDFKDKAELNAYVNKETERMKTNAIKRSIRLHRKIHLQRWDYFVTITYSDELHTEESFRKKLSNTLKHLVARKGWKYIGVWERGGDTDRLHFHGLFHIPEDGMIGELTEVKDYDVRNHRMQTTLQNTHFQKHFGRNDFEEIEFQSDVSRAVKYIMKYIEKSGERLVYGGKLPTYFLSDILENDIICPTGIDDRKALLFDDFICIDEGEIIGNVSKEVIDKMPKRN